MPNSRFTTRLLAIKKMAGINLKPIPWDESLPIPRLSAVWAIGLISCAAFLSYIKSVNGEFVFDDMEAIINNRDILEDTPLSYLFFHDFWGNSMLSSRSHKSYRPLTVLSFRLVAQLSGRPNPYPYHILNIFLHMIVSCLTYSVYNMILDNNSKASFMSAMLFAVHPIHSECVAGIVGLAELQSAFFALLAFICYYRACRKHSILSTACYTFGCCILSTAAMLCKEQGITVIGVCFLYDLIFIERITPDVFLNLRDGWKKIFCKFLATRAVVLILVTQIILKVRWDVMDGNPPVFQIVDNPTVYEENFIVRVLNYNYLYALNALLLLWPQWLCFDWSMGCIPLITLENGYFSDVRITAIVVFWTIFILLIYGGIFKNSGTTQRIMMMALGSVVIFFLPATNIFFNVGFVIAERVLYLPSFGYCLLIIVGIQRLSRLPKFKWVIRSMLAILLATYMARSMVRSVEWSSGELLYRRGLSTCPLNAKVHFNYAKEMHDLKKNESLVIRHYEESLRLYPDYYHAMNNLGNVYKGNKNYETAVAYLEKAAGIEPNFTTTLLNLGVAYDELGRHDEAEKILKRALKLKKRYPECYYNLGNVYKNMNKGSFAVKAWKSALSMNPVYIPAWRNLIIYLEEHSQLMEALDASRGFVTYLPNEAIAHYHLANVLSLLGFYEDGKKHFKKALSLNPMESQFHVNLGTLYFRTGKLCKAKYHYKLALSLDSNSKIAKGNYGLLEKHDLSHCVYSGLESNNTR